MKRSKLSLISRSASACALVVAAGCAVDAGSTGERGDEAEPIATEVEPLIACHQTYHHGGNLWEQEYEIIQGCACPAGHQRDFYTVTHAGNGNCWAIGWASPDPNDCHVRVRIKDSAGWVYGDCTTRVEAKSASSCDGRCGGRAPGGCWCDSACVAAGDCCSDYAPECNPNSCEGSCGHQAPGGCWCDAACDGYGDCCSDKRVACGG
jgi:hypothetical protein